MSEFEKQLNKTAKQLIKKADNRQKRGQEPDEPGQGSQAA